MTRLGVGQPLYKAPVPPPQSALDYALQPERITVPIVFVSAPVPLPKPKPFILPPELDSYPPDLMARARRMRLCRRSSTTSHTKAD